MLPFTTTSHLLTALLIHLPDPEDQTSVAYNQNKRQLGILLKFLMKRFDLITDSLATGGLTTELEAKLAGVYLSDIERLARVYPYQFKIY